MIETAKLQILSQIIETMGQISKKMEESIREGNKEGYEAAKKEILKLQEQTSGVLE